MYIYYNLVGGNEVMLVVYHMGRLDVSSTLELALRSDNCKCRYDLWAHLMIYTLEATILDYQVHHGNNAIEILQF